MAQDADKIVPTMNAKTSWTQRLDFSMLSLWLVLGVILAIISFLWFGVDFRGYYAAARVLLAGGNPYDYDLVARELLAVTGEMGNNPYYYPPWYAWLFVPLTYLPFQSARAVWMIFNFCLWNVGVWQLGNIIGWPARGWRRYGLFALSTFSFAWITWRYEQAGILVLGLLIALILSMKKGDEIGTGLWLALLLIKPNITLFVVAGLSFWLLRKGQWRSLLVMVLALLVLFAVSTWITPDWYQPFFEEGFGRGLTEALDGPDRVVALRINTTFLDWLRVLGVSSGPARLLYGLALCAGLFLFFRVVYRSEDMLELLSTLLLISYTLTPYALQYDYPPLVIVLLWALSRCASSPRNMVVGWGLAAFIFSVIFWQQNISWAYWMVVGLVALFVWMSLHSRKDLARQP